MQRFQSWSLVITNVPPAKRGENIMPQLSKDFIETGKASFSYINVLFMVKSQNRRTCRSDNRKILTHFGHFTMKYLMHNLQQSKDDNAWLTPDKALELAREYTPNIDLAKLKEDMGSKQIEDQVGLDEELVREYNVQQTPTIMINNVMVSNPFDYEEISSLINAQLME